MISFELSKDRAKVISETKARVRFSVDETLKADFHGSIAPELDAPCFHAFDQGDTRRVHDAFAVQNGVVCIVLTSEKTGLSIHNHQPRVGVYLRYDKQDKELRISLGAIQIKRMHGELHSEVVLHKDSQAVKDALIEMLQFRYGLDHEKNFVNGGINLAEEAIAHIARSQRIPVRILELKEKIDLVEFSEFLFDFDQCQLPTVPKQIVLRTVTESENNDSYAYAPLKYKSSNDRSNKAINEIAAWNQKILLQFLLTSEKPPTESPVNLVLHSFQNTETAALVKNSGTRPQKERKIELNCFASKISPLTPREYCLRAITLDHYVGSIDGIEKAYLGMMPSKNAPRILLEEDTLSGYLRITAIAAFPDGRLVRSPFTSRKVYFQNGIVCERHLEKDDAARLAKERLFTRLIASELGLDRTIHVPLINMGWVPYRNLVSEFLEKGTFSKKFTYLPESLKEIAKLFKLTCATKDSGKLHVCWNPALNGWAAIYEYGDTQTPNPYLPRFTTLNASKKFSDILIEVSTLLTCSREGGTISLCN